MDNDAWRYVMNDPLEIMDEIESDQARVVALVPNGCLIVTAPEWQSLRTAIEAQAEELAQVQEKLVEFEPVEGNFIAAVEALREFRRKTRGLRRRRRNHEQQD